MMYKPRAPRWIVGRRREQAKDIVFEDGFKLALPDGWMRGNNGVSQEYRLVDVLAVADNMKGWEDITVGSVVVLHELDSLPIDPTGDKSLVTFGAEVVQALVVSNDLSSN